MKQHSHSNIGATLPWPVNLRRRLTVRCEARSGSGCAACEPLDSPVDCLCIGCGLGAVLIENLLKIASLARLTEVLIVFDEYTRPSCIRLARSSVFLNRRARFSAARANRLRRLSWDLLFAKLACSIRSPVFTSNGSLSSRSNGVSRLLCNLVLLPAAAFCSSLKVILGNCILSLSNRFLIRSCFLSLLIEILAMLF